MPAHLVRAFRVALDIANETLMDDEENGHKRYRTRVIERILTEYEGFDNEDMAYLIDRLVHTPEAAH